MPADLDTTVGPGPLRVVVVVLGGLLSWLVITLVVASLLSMLGLVLGPTEVWIMVGPVVLLLVVLAIRRWRLLSPSR